MKPNTKSITIIIEWENVLLSEIERCQTMLTRLNEQVQQLFRIAENSRFSDRSKEFLSGFSAPVEVLILFDQSEVDEASVKEVVTRAMTDSSLIRIIYEPVEGKRYYELKNHGAQRAQNDIIVFLDSDVIPDEYWLLYLLESFKNPAVDAAAGNAYIDPENIYAKAFALSWFFPLKVTEAALSRANHFFANNVAFKRDIFLKYLFPVEEETTRGACMRLAKILAEDQVGLFKNTAAQVTHPPPKGLKHFCLRGLAQGRDQIMPLIIEHGHTRWIFMQIFERFFRNISFTWRNTFAHYKDVRLPVIAIPLALFQMEIYYLFYLEGELLTFFWPTRMQKSFQI